MMDLIGWIDGKERRGDFSIIGGHKETEQQV